MTDAEKQYKAERAGGNYGAGTKELQARGPPWFQLIGTCAWAAACMAVHGGLCGTPPTHEAPRRAVCCYASRHVHTMRTTGRVAIV
jgi:hypothetical protein